MADRTNGDVGTSPNQILADKLNRFQSGGRFCPPQTLVPTNIFDIPAPLNVGRFSAFLWFHTYQNITLVQGQMRFWIGSTDMRLCPPQYNFCFEIPYSFLGCVALVGSFYRLHLFCWVVSHLVSQLIKQSYKGQIVIRMSPCKIAQPCRMKDFSVLFECRSNLVHYNKTVYLLFIKVHKQATYFYTQLHSTFSIGFQIFLSSIKIGN